MGVTTNPRGPDGPEPDSFYAEGPLPEALVCIWDQARAKKTESIAVMTVRMFEAGDAFRLLGAVNAVQGAKPIVTLKGGYETQDNGTLEFDFRGPVSDAQPLREFLEPQLRAAVSQNLR